MLPQFIHAMVNNGCLIIKWLFSTGAKIDDRLVLKITASIGLKWLLLLMLFCKWNVSQLHIQKALHDPWCLLFPCRRVSLAEYILVLRFYFLLLQMTCFTWASASTASTQRVTRIRSLERDSLLVSFSKCFCWMWTLVLALSIWTKCVRKLLPLLSESGL
jgi:hypothetical protein